VLEPISPGGAPIRLVLAKADASVKPMPNCESLADSGPGWIGGELRIKPPGGSYTGPVNGEHDTHWYVHKQKGSLHVVEGYAWHAGLPLEDLLSASKSLKVRGWDFRTIVGLDLSGELNDGRRWRWIGAPLAAAVSYENASPEVADFFDRILDSVCYAGR